MPTSRKKSSRSRRAGLLLVAVTVLSSCSEEPTADTDASPTSEAQYPAVEDVEISVEDDDTYTLDVTISSPYDTPDRYADGWRVLDADGAELGTMRLGHDHANEQPFTRTQVGLEIPAEVAEVTVEGHDSKNGYGGATQTVDVPQ